MNRRSFLASIPPGLALAGHLGCTSAGRASIASERRLRRIGLQLYSLRADARQDLERTIADIAAIGYDDVELLGSFDNFGMSPARLREVLDRNGLRAPSTHVGGSALDDLDRQLDHAETLGHEYIIVASLPSSGERSLDDYRRWADRFNEAGQRARARGIWIGFHNHAGDHAPIDGVVPYDVFVERTEPSLVRHQLDTGNAAMANRDPFEYLRRYGSRYWSFHIKDVQQFGASSDTELGAGIIDFRRFIGEIENVDQKHLFVEQETYPGTPLDSVRRDYEWLAGLRY